ncbi:L-type lectin-domain containing receptor kinase IX-1 [Nymphaea thermarum]|nr:L-type lectin-domain containing receptor kinase IX-1 [Nymphaea thermarum]
MARHAIMFLMLALIPSSIGELIFNFTDFPPKVPEINFFDDAEASDQSTLAPSIINITSNPTSPNNNTFRQGRAVYNKPVPLYDSSGSVWDFTTHFKFVIDGLGNPKTGDGMAFFLAPVNWSPPMNSTGCWLGLFNETTNGLPTNPVVAVEFDTFQNAEDPAPQHVGIDVHGVYSKFTVPWQWDSTRKLNGEATVVYNHTDGTLSATLVYQNGSKRCNISRPIDLTTVLPENISIGFSAATGHYTEHHFILSWDFTSTVSGTRIGNIKSYDKNKNKTKLIILLAACSVAVVVVLFGVLVTTLVLKRRKKITQEDMVVEQEEVGVAEDEGAELLDLATGPRRFSYAELAVATKNFNEKWKLGQGGFGGVYFGVLPDTGKEVAVKRFWRGSSQGKKEFLAEVTVISRLRHRNLVPLTGWCHDRGELMLVYDYMNGGSLDVHLFKPKAGEVMPWDRRMNVALGLASAVLYLHEEWEQCVVHRDIKSSNVMIDSKFCPRLGDFGLARLVDHSRSAQTTMVAGTMGYLAPECVITGKATKDSEIVGMLKEKRRQKFKVVRPLAYIHERRNSHSLYSFHQIHKPYIRY